MAIAQDASTPVVATALGSTTTTLATASFTPPAGSLLVAMAGLAYATSGTTAGAATISVSDSLALTWTPGNVQPASKHDPASGVWVQAVTSSAARTVTLTTDGTKKGKLLQVIVLTGADTTTMIGSNAGNVTGSGEISLTTTTTGSWVVGAFGYDTGTALTADAHTSNINTLLDNTDVVWLAAFKSASATGTPGATTFGYTGGSSANSPAIAVAEILPAATSTPNLPLRNVTWNARSRAATW